MKHPMIYEGFTEPGDVLLNPPFLWHYVLTDKGFNLAVTYKQDRFEMFAALARMNPIHAMFLKPMIEKRGMHMPPLPAQPEEASALQTNVVYNVWAATAQSCCWEVAMFEYKILTKVWGKHWTYCSGMFSWSFFGLTLAGCLRCFLSRLKRPKQKKL